ncbi:MAG: amylosucrase [bacterium]|nr:amylosucrase [bacterium]
MYEQVSHSLLNEILDELKPEVRRQDLRYFYIRLGANFYAIYSLFYLLYGKRADFKEQMVKLVSVMANQYLCRAEELEITDKEREKDHNWFLNQQWVGMALYADGFAGNLNGVRAGLPYLQELGINMLHIMPMLKCPEGASDGGYAVSDFRDLDERIGTLEDIQELAGNMHKRDMLLALDVVVNHTSNEHEWAKKARAGDSKFRDYYYTFETRDVPDMFEETMPEIFPETAPGNFTWDGEMNRWVMTVFNNYQWDLNYSNPSVFIEMIDIILFWANQGADIIRLDAVAFLWKKIGSSCQNEREAHLILQLMKDCCQVVAPGVVFIAEAIVAPLEIIKYFGEDAVNAKECEIAYNATLMALLWDAVATHNAKLLNCGIRSLPDKLDRATWLNYIRCHDDIGLGFDDNDIIACGYNPHEHRKFLVNYLTGNFKGSNARGLPFGNNPKTGDARISGSLASLAGLETALGTGDQRAIDHAIKRIILLHSLILSFGGIPLLYYGDEIGTLNDCSFLKEESKAHDNRWMHRPRINWDKAELRKKNGTVENRIFESLKRLIALRKTIPEFADFNNRDLIELYNPHLFAFWRSQPEQSSSHILVVCNFDSSPQHMNLTRLGNRGMFRSGSLRDLCSNSAPASFGDQLVIPPLHFYWLTDRI